MRITAVAATMLDGFEPSSWTRLPGSDADRVLVTDGDRTFIVSVATPDRVAAAQAERMASKALSPLLPSDAPAIPHVVAARTMDGSSIGCDGDVTLMISDPMPGLPLSTAMFEEFPRLVESLARAVAAVHAADPGPIADAGLVVEESAETRERLLADLDSAASTGRVPARLLSRWEEALEEVSAWRFLPVPIHANLGPDALWATDEEIVGIGDLSRLRVGDPAADLAAVSSMLSPEDFERFFRTYRSRRDPDDPGLRRRVGFHAEITVLEWLLAAVAAQDDDAIEDAAHLLDALADVTVDNDDTDTDLGPDPGADANADTDVEDAESSAHTAVDSFEHDGPTAGSVTSAVDTSEASDGDDSENIFRPSARIDAGVDEDGIATESLDTSALHLRDVRADDRPEPQE